MDEPHRDPEPLGDLSWLGYSKFVLFEPVNPKVRKPKQKVHQLDTIPAQEEVEEPEEQEGQAPAHRHELAGELSFTFGGHEYNQRNSLKTLRELARNSEYPSLVLSKRSYPTEPRLSRVGLSWKQRGTWGLAQPRRSARSL